MNISQYALEQSQGIQEQIPAVPANKPPQINPVAAEKQDEQGKKPAGDFIGFLLHDPVNQVYGDKAQQEAGPYENRVDYQVVPDKKGVVIPEMNKISDHIGSIGIK
jgi:hypothetical protein